MISFRFTRKNIDPAPLGEHGLVEELLKRLTATAPTNNSFNGGCCVKSLFGSLLRPLNGPILLVYGLSQLRPLIIRSESGSLYHQATKLLSNFQTLYIGTTVRTGGSRQSAGPAGSQIPSEGTVSTVISLLSSKLRSWGNVQNFVIKKQV